MSGRPFLRREEEVPAGAAGAANAGMGGEAVSGRSACGTPPPRSVRAGGAQEARTGPAPAHESLPGSNGTRPWCSLSSSQRCPSPECPHAEFLSLYAMQRPSPAPPDTARESLGELSLGSSLHSPCTEHGPCAGHEARRRETGLRQRQDEQAPFPDGTLKSVAKIRTRLPIDDLKSSTSRRFYAANLS